MSTTTWTGSCSRTTCPLRRRLLKGKLRDISIGRTDAKVQDAFPSEMNAMKKALLLPLVALLVAVVGPMDPIPRERVKEPI